MRDRVLFLFEGDTDTDFFNAIFYHRLNVRYRVRTSKYSNEEKEDVKELINSFNAFGECFFVHDFDDCRCMSQLKSKIKKNWGAQLDNNHIHIVKIEIESWYLAGINNEISRLIGFTGQIANTGNLNKGDFLKLRPSGMLKTEFYKIFLDYYDFEGAKTKNASFKRFTEKILP